MRINLYSIFDVAAGAYRKPFFMQADGEAMRGFKDLASNKETDVGQHPEDYSLVRHGNFDDQNGKLVGENAEVLITGLECVAQMRQMSTDLEPNEVEAVQ